MGRIKQKTLNILKEKNTQLEEELAQLKSEKNKQEVEWQQKSQEWDKQSQEKDSEIGKLQEQIDEKQRQINDNELKKLASAYADQENECREEASKWKTRANWAFSIAGIIVFVSILLTSIETSLLHRKIEVYLVNLLTFTYLVFSLKQYSYFNRLRTDYANRKTIAQSYHNILDSSDDEDLKPYFLEKAADVLCAKNEVSDESHTLVEKLADGVKDIVKKIGPSK